MRIVRWFLKKKRRLFLPVLPLLAAAGWFYADPGIRQFLGYEPQEGDFVFQSLPPVELVRAIEGITQSPYSHVGMIVKKDNSWYVRESLVTVHDTPLRLWFLQGRRCQFNVYRLKPELQKNVPGMVSASEKYLGRLYDYRYQMDDEPMYCSELLYRSYKDATGKGLGKLQKLGELNWHPYRSTLEKYEGGPPPLGRKMISPYSLANSPELVQVF